MGRLGQVRRTRACADLRGIVLVPVGAAGPLFSGAALADIGFSKDGIIDGSGFKADAANIGHFHRTRSIRPNISL